MNFLTNLFLVKKDSFSEFAISDDALLILKGNARYIFHRKGQTLKKGSRFQYVDEDRKKISGCLATRGERGYLFRDSHTSKITKKHDFRGNHAPLYL